MQPGRWRSARARMGPVPGVQRAAWTSPRPSREGIDHGQGHTAAGGTEVGAEPGRRASRRSPMACAPPPLPRGRPPRPRPTCGAQNTMAAKAKFQRNSAAVSLQEWQDAMINKGAARVASGANRRPTQDGSLPRAAVAAHRDVKAVPAGTWQPGPNLPERTRSPAAWPSSRTSDRDRLTDHG